MNMFFTPAQIEYGKSVAFRQLNDAVFKDLKQLEFNSRPGGLIRISLSVKPGSPSPIKYYREEDLETVVVCDHCTLHYAIYGLFAFCPDCGTHNSLQILNKNLDLVLKHIALSADQDDDALKRQLLENAIEDCVSAFDGFGRETCRVRASKSNNPTKAEAVSFQNVENAAARLCDLFGADLRSAVPPADWAAIHRAFMKRHVVAHRSGVVDDRYIAEAGDPAAIAGRRIPLAADEVTQLVDRLRVLGRSVINILPTP